MSLILNEHSQVAFHGLFIKSKVQPCTSLDTKENKHYNNIITDSSIEAVLMHTPTPAYICVDLHKPPNLPNSTGMGEVPDTGPVSLAVPV